MTMTMYSHSRPLTVITVRDHRNLQAAWKDLGHHSFLVGTWRCETPLTARQLGRLHRGLRARLVIGE
jgi:hypothetical protein